MTAIIKGITNSKLETLRGDWRYRAIEHTLGNQTPLGTILLAVLGLQGDRLPRLAPTCEIDVAGHFRVGFWDEHGDYRHASDMGPVQATVDAFRTLADEINATDVERENMFHQLRSWVRVDHRVVGGKVNSHGELEAPEA